MRISAKSEYGILALLYIASNNEIGPVTVSTMAQELKIPRRFLEQIVAAFKKKGLIKSIRGSHGGYVLARDPQTITMTDVLHITEGPFHTWGCVTESDHFYCSRENICAVRGIWQEVQNAVERVLGSFNLKEMCDKTRDLKRRQEVLLQAWSEAR